MKEVTSPIKISDSEWGDHASHLDPWSIDSTRNHADTRRIHGMESSHSKNFVGTSGEKEAVWTEQEGKNLFITPAVSETETVRSDTEESFFPYLRKRIGATIADLVEEATLTQEDIEMILDQLNKTASRIRCMQLYPRQCHCMEHQ